MRRLLTDRFCAAAKPKAGEAQTDFFDTDCAGLALRVSPKRKSWTLHLTLGGKRKRLTLGVYPTLSLAGARTRADEARAAIADGNDPRLLKPDTLQAICESYMKWEGGKLRSADWRQGVLDRHIYPNLGPRRISEIRRFEIVALLDRIEEGSGAAMADHVLAIIRKVMNWHATRTDDFRSPIVRGMARTSTKEMARERVLTDDEIRKVWHAGAGMFGDYIKLLLLTAARRGELAGMKWSEIVASDWTLPASRNKVRLDLVRPLSPMALEILTRQRKGGEWVWGGPNAIAFGVWKQQLDEVSEIRDWRLHDLRRTARSLMSRAGVPSDHAERCLGHVIGGVRGVYDRHEYHREKAQAFEALAALIDRIVSGSEGDVVQLKRGRER
ncbi:MAG: integrase arm-type DNA-binding domain-containing protein [Xanthobacteraceae bacterium]